MIQWDHHHHRSQPRSSIDRNWLLCFNIPYVQKIEPLQEQDTFFSTKQDLLPLTFYALSLVIFIGFVRWNAHLSTLERRWNDAETTLERSFIDVSHQLWISFKQDLRLIFSLSLVIFIGFVRWNAHLSTLERSWKDAETTLERSFIDVSHQFWISLSDQARSSKYGWYSLYHLLFLLVSFAGTLIYRCFPSVCISHVVPISIIVLFC